jgi:hypothetical protein
MMVSVEFESLVWISNVPEEESLVGRLSRGGDGTLEVRLVEEDGRKVTHLFSVDSSATEWMRKTHDGLTTLMIPKMRAPGRCTR